MRLIITLILILLFPTLATAQQDLPKSRPFYLGFTAFPHDFTPAAVLETRSFVQQNADLIAHHIEGVPWTESHSNQPYPEKFLKDWADKKLATPRNGKVYLAISPGRGELKPAEKAPGIPAALKNKPYDDPQVISAYLTYCRRAIEFFKPDYLCIGIETNEIHSSGPRKWAAYVTLHKHIYTQLKKDHPTLPIFASWTLHNMFKRQGAMLAEFKALMPHNDLVAVSYYPFFVDDKDRLTALDWMTAQFDEFKKPYAMVETNDAAERLQFPTSKITIHGTPEKQLAYHQKLFDIAHEKKFVFVVAFIHQDYDALWEKIKGSSPELFIAWRDCGLLDQSANPRPAYHLWKSHFDLPHLSP
jgi:hypothetical protein